MSIFGKLPLVVIKNPAGTYSYVGSIPHVLGKEVPASRGAVMGGRAFYDATGTLVEVKFPTFPTAAEAVAFAESKGCKVEQVCE